jgi:hypothetical protein
MTIDVGNDLSALCVRIRAALNRREAGFGGPLQLENLVHEAVCQRHVTDLNEVARELDEPLERVQAAWQSLVEEANRAT